MTIQKIQQAPVQEYQVQEDPPQDESRDSPDEGSSQDDSSEDDSSEEKKIAGALADLTAKWEAIRARSRKGKPPKPDVCELCGDTYRGSRGYQSHYEARHERECQICKKVFKLKHHFERTYVVCPLTRPTNAQV